MAETLEQRVWRLANTVSTKVVDPGELETTLFEVHDALAAMSWQSIETAPKDGTPVLGCWRGFGAGPHVGEMEWKRDWYGLGSKHFEGWWTMRGGPTARDPHAWMPLPSPNEPEA